MSPIKKSNIILACLAHLQDMINTGFIYAKFLTLYNLETPLGQAIIISTAIMGQIGLSFTFTTSTLPSVIEHQYLHDSKINHILQLCKKALYFETNALMLKKESKYKIPIMINTEVLKREFNLSTSDIDKFKEMIMSPPWNYKAHVEIIIIENPDELIPSLHNPQPVTKYGYGNNEAINLLYYGPQSLTSLPYFKPINVIDLDKGYLKRIFLEYAPISLTSLAAILSFNHLVERFFGNSEQYALWALWLVEISAFSLAIPKTFTNYRRKFLKARGNWECLIYRLLHGRHSFRIHNSKNWLKFIFQVILPTSSSTFTYVLSALFIVISGAIDQIIETTCLLTNKKLCSYQFDTLHPEIPQWQYNYIAPPLMLIAFTTMLFTQGFTNFENFKKEIELNDTTTITLNHPRTWKGVITAIFIDSCQVSVTIFASASASIAYLAHKKITDLVPMLLAIYLAIFSGISYFIFQSSYAKSCFNQTYEQIAQLKNRAKEAFHSVRASCCSFFSRFTRSNHGMRREYIPINNEEAPAIGVLPIR